ncbi:MAG: HD-GYP domain-containing protein [Vulcanimicrobiota bacterium]
MTTSLNSITRAWYLLVGATALTLLPVMVEGVRNLPAVSSPWSLLLLALGIWFGLHRTVRLNKGEFHSVYTLDDAPTFAVVFLFSTPVAVLTVCAVRLSYELARLSRGLRLHRDRVTAGSVLYHFSDIVFVSLATFMAGCFLDLLGRPHPLTGAAGAGAALLAGAAWFLTLFVINAVHLSIFLGTPGAWSQKALDNIRENLSTAGLFLPIGLLMSVFLPTHPFLVPLLFVPVILIHAVMEASAKLEVETEQTILALSTYLEERDGYTSGHSRRVAGYAAAIAREIGFGADEIETTHRAGLIHDLGKIDVPDAILRKPGFLTEEERAVMRTHTDRAVDLGHKLVALKKGLPFHLAAYHHENFDGSGQYRMAGERIPVVSRMLAVADTFDAMTSDRPYRTGMNDSEALLRLKKAAGTQLDPALVTAFLKVYDKGHINQVRSEVPSITPSLAV